MQKEIRNTILHFCQKINDDKNHRYRSWEHCYQYFQGWQGTDRKDFDLPALHLAFYLASWGMYRGSSMLLQKDYKIHLPVVKELVKKQHELLWHTDGLIISNQDFGNQLFDLIGALRSIYRASKVTPTDTLITKVLLGTLGCVPAYDRLFKLGVFRWNESEVHDKFPARFGFKSIRGILLFCNVHKNELIEAQEAVTQMRGCRYPIMKLVDMYFWELGNT